MREKIAPNELLAVISCLHALNYCHFSLIDRYSREHRIYVF